MHIQMPSIFKINQKTMKAIIVLILISVIGLVALSSCRNPLKSGNGKVTTEERKITPFTRVTIEGLFPVDISQTGDKESVKVETDANLQSQITVTNDGDELIIKNTNDESINKSSKTKIYINIKNLKELNFKSVGSLSTTGVLKLDSLNLNTESVGKLDMDLDVDYLHANLSSVGGTTLNGKVHEARINNRSMGTLSAFGLKVGTMMIHNTSVGVTEVYADSAFYIRSSSVGALYYKGPGLVKELNSEGIGVVKKQD